MSRWIQVTAWNGMQTAPYYIPADEIGLIGGPVEMPIPKVGSKMVTELALKGTTHRESLLVVETPEVILERAGAALDEDGRALPWKLYACTTNETGRLVQVEFRASGERVVLHAIESPPLAKEEGP